MRHYCPCGQNCYETQRETLYLSGPINGCTDEEAWAWRQMVVAQLGTLYQIINPMDRDYRGREEDHATDIVEADIEDIHRADVVLAHPWKTSVGTAMECWEAGRDGRLLVVVKPEPCSPWWEFVAVKMVPTVEAAIAFLRHRVASTEGGVCWTIIKRKKADAQENE